MNRSSTSILSIASMAATVLLAGSLQAAPVTIARSVPYGADAEIARKVRDECTELNTQLSAYTQQFAREFDVALEVADAAAPGDAGRVLVMQIDEAVSMGNAFIGHQKYSRISGTLFQDGEQVATFRARRNSMGGAFAGYKGSCSVLGRTMRALGRDVAEWLRDPVDGARLGDM